MGRVRFDDLWSAMIFSDQPEERKPGEDSSIYQWKLVDDFVKNFNEYTTLCCYQREAQQRLQDPRHV